MPVRLGWNGADIMKLLALSLSSFVLFSGCGGGTSQTAVVTPKSITAIAAESGFNVVITPPKVTSPVIADPKLTNNLQVYKNGVGVVMSDLPGISCGDACLAAFNKTSSVTLTALAPPGYAFMYWSGGCSGAVPSCKLLMATPQIVTAAFTSVLALNAKVDCVFDWAEKQFAADYWPAAKSQLLNGYYARYYSGSKNYLAFNMLNSHLYYIDPIGYTYDYGPIISFTIAAGC